MCSSERNSRMGDLLGSSHSRHAKMILELILVRGVRNKVLHGIKCYKKESATPLELFEPSLGSIGSSQPCRLVKRWHGNGARP